MWDIMYSPFRVEMEWCLLIGGFTLALKDDDGGKVLWKKIKLTLIWKLIIRATNSSLNFFTQINIGAGRAQVSPFSVAIIAPLVQPQKANRRVQELNAE